MPDNKNNKQKGSSDFDLEEIISGIVEHPAEEFLIKKDGYVRVGNLIRGTEGCLSIKSESFCTLFHFIKKYLPQELSRLSDGFISKTINDFLVKVYLNRLQTATVNELLNIFKALKPQKINILVPIFNLQMDVPEYDGGSFALYEPEYFDKKYPSLYKIITKAEKNSVRKLNLVFKSVEIFCEDQKLLDSVIKEKSCEFISFMSVAVGEKNYAQCLTTVVYTGFKGHRLFDTNMQEIGVSESVDEKTTFLKGRFSIKAELFFKTDKIFNLLSTQNTSLEKKLYKSILWLGKSLQTENINDSFLQVAIALECLLARQEKGYFIQASLTYYLSETLAFLIADNKEERISVFKKLKIFYGLRSAIVHSGKAEMTDSEYYDFFNMVKSGICKILDLMEIQKFTKIEEVCDYVNGVKFGGNA